jgi:large subunit ribosomal protein L4
MKAAALRGALSDRARNERIHVFTGLVEGEKPSVKSAKKVLALVSLTQKSLVVLHHGDELGLLSMRNLDSVHVLTVDQLNTRDVLVNDHIVFTKDAFDALLAGPARGRSGKGIASSTEVELEAAE